jgi:hypothetical protein
MQAVFVKGTAEKSLRTEYRFCPVSMAFAGGSSCNNCNFCKKEAA